MDIALYMFRFMYTNCTDELYFCVHTSYIRDTHTHMEIALYIYIYIVLDFKLYDVGLGTLFGELQFSFVEQKSSRKTTERGEE
jgi:hypothetical protein